MKLKKKGFVAGSLMLTAALALSACSTNSDNASDETTDTTIAGGITDRNVKIAFSAPAADHGWLLAVTNNAKTEADTYDDVDFELLEGTNDAASQVAQIRTLISSKPDILVILPSDGDALTSVALEAMAAGIQVVNVDREFNDPGAARVTVLGDNYGAGLKAGQYFAEQLNCSGNVVEIQGIAGIAVTNDRSQGFKDGIAQCNDGIKIVDSQPADFSEDRGLTVMNDILQAQGDIDAVYTHDDDMAQGVVRAITNSGREDEMWLTGVGGSKAAFDQIKEGGVYRATFLYNPTMSASAVSLGRLLAQGKGLAELSVPDVPREVILDAAQVDKDNVDQYYSLGF